MLGTALGAALITVVDYRIIAAVRSVVMITCASRRTGAGPPLLRRHCASDHVVNKASNGQAEPFFDRTREVWGSPLAQA